MIEFQRAYPLRFFFCLFFRKVDFGKFLISKAKKFQTLSFQAINLHIIFSECPRLEWSECNTALVKRMLVDDEPLKEVDSFTYLRSVLDIQGGKVSFFFLMRQFI